MRIIDSGHKVMHMPDREEILRILEQAGRTCYKSEDKITDDSAAGFVGRIIRSGHESVIEHVNITVKFIVDRGVSHELVRHRLAAYSQESTRYCNYSKGRFDQEITVIKPCFWGEGTSEYEMWALAMEEAEANYMGLLKLGANPQQARSVLPNSLKTEVVMTANLREWRHVLRLRTSKAAHPQIRQVMLGLSVELKGLLPEVFGDIEVEYPEAKE